MFKARSVLLLALAAAACTPESTGNAPPAPATLTVKNDGPGKVTSLPAGIDCGDTCVMQFRVGDTVSLTATANEGGVFAGWSEASCTGALCSVTLAKDTFITATFKSQFLVNVAVGGSGKGKVTSSASSLTCSDTGCQGKVTEGDKVTLTAVADPGYVFYGWTGDCSGSSTCELDVKRLTVAKAIFWGAPYLSEAPINGSNDVNLNLWVSGLGGEDTHPVSAFTDADFGDYDTAGVTASADGTFFVGTIYYSDMDGERSNIFLVDAEKKSQRPLTTFARTYAWSPRISADGKTVYFISDRDPSKAEETSLSDGTNSLWRVSADGTGLSSIGDGLGGARIDDVEVSPDGSMLLVLGYPNTESGTGPSTFWLMVNDGTGAKQIAQSNDVYSNWWPRWSPDGKAVVFLSNRDLTDPTKPPVGYNPNLWRLDMKNAEQTMITSFTNIGYPRYPSWSPNSQLLAFDAQLDPTDPTKESDVWSIWTIKPDGTGLKFVVSGSPDSYEHAPMWTPDGSFILFSDRNTSGGSGWDLLKVDAAGNAGSTSVVKSSKDDVTLGFDWD